MSVFAFCTTIAVCALGGFALTSGAALGGYSTYTAISGISNTNKTTAGFEDAWRNATGRWNESMNKTLTDLGFDSLEDVWAEMTGRGKDNQPYVYDQA